MRSYLNPDSNEENGFIRLAQRCCRCAYVCTSSADENDIISADFVCQRHNQSLSSEEYQAFVCDYFC